MIGGQAYLSVCTPYRDDASYLQEWIEFHRLVGIDRFYLYNNGSSDDHRKILAPYVERGTVTVYDWPIPAIGDTGRPSGIIRAFDHCVERHRTDSRWIAFIDIDEFLFSPARATISELLTDYEGSPGIAVHRAEFGTSGHRTRPAGLVIENYVHRVRQDPDSRAYFKSIIDPLQVTRCASVHHFLYRDGFAVDENKIPVVTGIRAEKTFVSFSRLRINHYRTKSEEELSRKLELWKDAGKLQMEPPTIRLKLAALHERDETITTYVPPLQEALRGDN